MAPAREELMFNNLIESSSHKGELKRRGSFFLFTVATYALLFVIAGVASIYAYDAKLEDQNLEVVVTMVPVTDFPKPTTVTPQRTQPGARSSSNNQMIDVRRDPTAAVDMITTIPDKISSQPNPNLPVRGPYTVGRSDSNAVALPGGPVNSLSGGTGGPVQVVEIETPPPAPTPVAPPKIFRSQGVLNGKALQLPRPAYPPMAKQLRIAGPVNVQVLIDETGKVVSARVMDGHPMLKQAAERAAYQAVFSPTKLGDQPVKVSGVITYNFVLQ
jgi:periplasmic protein TonB